VYLYHEMQYVSGSEKGAIFWHFSSTHHFKAVRASLGLWAHQAFCFTNPTFQAVYSLLSDMVAIKPEV